MSTVNTGNEIVVDLLRVRQDIVDTGDPFYREPLDVNDVPTRISGLPQHSKPNTQSDADYIAPYENLTSCPLVDFLTTNEGTPILLNNGNNIYTT